MGYYVETWMLETTAAHTLDSDDEEDEEVALANEDCAMSDPPICDGTTTICGNMGINEPYAYTQFGCFKPDECMEADAFLEIPNTTIEYWISCGATKLFAAATAAFAI